jgi:hypothetical protein
MVGFTQKNKKLTRLCLVERVQGSALHLLVRLFFALQTKAFGGLRVERKKAPNERATFGFAHVNARVVELTPTPVNSVVFRRHIVLNQRRTPFFSWFVSCELKEGHFSIYDLRKGYL